MSPITNSAIITCAGVLLFGITLASPALADPDDASSLVPLNAKHCVQLGRDEKAKSQTLTNTCSEKIEIAWCHTGSKEKGTHIGVCGEGKFFRQHKTLAMGESVKSRATLPVDARINFAACIGGYYSIMADGNTGHYTCRHPKAAKTEAEKHEPAFPKSIFKGMVELRDTAAEKWKLELEKQCHDNRDSAACTELKLTYEKKKDPVASSGIVSISPDSKRLVFGGNYGLESLALPTLSKKQILEKRDLGGIAWTPDGKNIVTIGQNSSIMGSVNEPICTIVTDWSSNSISSKFQDCTERIHHQTRTSTVAVSPDGKFALTSNPYTLHLTDINSGKRIKEHSFFFKSSKGDHDASDSIYGMAFSPDGRHVAMLCSKEYQIHIYELPSFKLVKSIETIADIFEWPKHMPRKLIYSPDGRTVITAGGEDGEIEYWDTDSGAKTKIIKAHTTSSVVNSVADLHLSNSGRFLVSGGDASTKIWDYNKGEEVATFIRFEDDEWLVMTPDGYYNASPRGDQYLSVTEGGKPLPYEQVRNKYYRPDTVRQSLKALTAPPGETPVEKYLKDNSKTKN